jgi:BlaI family penicillinase repressor
MAGTAPTGRELEILKILWERGRATVRDVHEALTPETGELAYTTVLSLMQIMEQKGLVTRATRGKAHVYFAKVKKDSVLRKLARGFLDRVFDGAMDQYLVRVLQTRNPSMKELEELEQMIAEAKQKAQARIKREGP